VASDAPGIDYDAVAGRYREGRSLDAGQLATWAAAVAPHLPEGRPLRVLDLGAGTGIFAWAWPAWVDCRVVALEPSAGMRRQLVAAAPTGASPPAGTASGAVHVVAGRAEALPLRAGAVDVAWLSAVVHHLGSGWQEEIVRVLAPGGRLLVRGLFADRGRGPGWLRFVPDEAAARALAAFPRSDLDLPGLRRVAAVEVDEPAHHTVGEAIGWVQRMRDVDTLLRQLTDDELDAANLAMAARPSDEALAPAQLSLIVLAL
jgi:SAM-dependent methyltransferase